MSITQLPMTIFPPRCPLPGIGVSFSSSWNLQIASRPVNDSTQKEMDIFDSLRNVHLPVYCLYMLLFLATLVLFIMFSRILRNAKTRVVSGARLSWDLITLIIRQPIELHLYSHIESIRVLLLDFSLAILFLIIFYNNAMQTDLTVTAPLEKVYNLEDLVTSHFKPAFEGTTALAEQFEFAREGTVLEKVWKKVQSYNGSYKHIYAQEALLGLGSVLNEGDIAMIGPDMPLSMVRGFLCANRQAGALFFSPSLAGLSWIMGTMISSGVQHNFVLRERLELTFNRLTELGYFVELDRTAAIKFIRDMGQGSDGELNFYKCFNAELNDGSGQIVKAIEFDDMDKLLRNSGIAFLVVIVVLLFEYIVHWKMRRVQTRRLNMFQARVRHEHLKHGKVSIETLTFKRVVINNW